MPYDLTVTGSARDGFAAVEIESDGEVVARVFEVASGWHVETRLLEHLRSPEFVAAILGAKEELLPYVNRTGVGMPKGLTVAGASLWLMQRIDGEGFSLPRPPTR